MATLSLDRVGKVYPDGTRAVSELSLEITNGELLVLVGPSGCGKTTVLRMVAGLEEISEGTIALDDQIMNEMAERERDIAMVFQTYALYPHMTVFDNIAFPLKLAKVSRSERETRVRAVAATLQLERLLGQRPGELSGGQRQRVAMGRAIVREPSLFLMDEPLSNLDAKLRVQMRAEILELQRRLATTTMYVTHDQYEAMTLGDRVAVMRGGVLQQIGEPGAIYESPVNLFVAAFFGHPPMNLVEGDLTRVGQELVVRVGSSILAIDETELRRHPRMEEFVGRQVVIGIRPEHLVLRNSQSISGREISTSLRLLEVVGSDIFGHLSVANAKPLSQAARGWTLDVEDPTELQDLSGAEIGMTMIGRFASESSLVIGDVLPVGVRPGAMRLFDPQSGLAI